MMRQMDYFIPVVLKGTRVALEPLSLRHLDDLAVTGANESVWRWLPSAHYLPGSMPDFIETAMAAHARRSVLPFATIDLLTNKAVGSTRYLNIAIEHRRLEIGLTWIGIKYQRSYINTEAKLLQLWYAFEILKCRRIEFKTDVENMKSRTAVLRLGAKEEGIFRKHMLYSDDRNRDSAYFSIVDDEWPEVRARLKNKLGYPVAPAFAKAYAT